MKFIGLAIMVALAACGTDDTAAALAGTWMPAPGAVLTLNCNGNAVTDMLTSAEVFAKGVDANLATTSGLSSGSCTLRYDVNGKTATARAGQSCTEMENGLTIVITIQTATLTLGADSEMMTESVSGTAQVTGTVTGTCTVGATYTLSKVSN